LCRTKPKEEHHELVIGVVAPHVETQGFLPCLYFNIRRIKKNEAHNSQGIAMIDSYALLN